MVAVVSDGDGDDNDDDDDDNNNTIMVDGGWRGSKAFGLDFFEGPNKKRST